MFSLIITIVSIALVAALALATLYYGGNAFDQANANARAAQIDNQSQQLLGAADLYFANTGRWPQDIDELVQGNYLKSIPVVKVSVGPAMAQTVEWAMVTPNMPVFMLDTQEAEVCRSINEQRIGDRGIAPTLDPTLISQCFGPASNRLVTVVSKDPRWLTEAVEDPAASEKVASAGTASRPAANATTGWTVSPSAPVVRGSAPQDGGDDNGSGSGGGTTSPEVSGSLSTSPSSLNFGEITPGSSASQTFQVRNTGTASLTLLQAPAASGAHFRSSTDCSAGQVLSPAAQCSVTVTYEPTAYGSHAGVVNVNSSAGDAAVGLAGTTPEAPSSALTASRSSVAFGPRNISESAQLPVTFTNAGSTVLTVSTPTTTGTGFTSTTTCGASLSPGASCTVTVTFAPVAETSYSGTLTFNSNVASGPLNLSLSGSGARVTGTFEAVNGTAFGNVTVNSTRSLPFRFFNTGDTSASGTYAAVTGSNLAIGTNNCGTAAAPVSLDAGDFCTVWVNYTPTSLATLSNAKVELVSPLSVSSPYSYTLTGGGVVTDVASGGAITTAGNYIIHRFTAGGTFVLERQPIDGLLDVLVVGGGGGAANGGGGGGGVVFETRSFDLGSYNVIVGAGGSLGASSATGAAPSNGGFSSFGTDASLRAAGGGAGGRQDSNGQDGGSGGGAGSSASVLYIGGASNPTEQGNKGGDGHIRGNRTVAGNTAVVGGAGGGAGAGGPGLAGSRSKGGNGGAPRHIDLDADGVVDDNECFGAGGGGGFYGGSAFGDGGTAGNGNGCSIAASGTRNGSTSGTGQLAASPSKGAGGAGAGNGNNGGAGGSGVVVIRYRFR